MKKITLLLVFLFASIVTFGQATSVDCSGGPVNVNYCYSNNDSTTWLYQSSDGSPLRLTFNSGGIESCCDDILVYDGVDNTGVLLYQGNNGGNLAGLQFDSTSDAIYMEIDADGSVSCASGSGCCTAPWDFTVSCATCVNPVATNTVRQDCVNGPQFYVDVNLTDLGSASSITISDNQGNVPVTTTVAGLFSFGPFPNGTGVVITVGNDDDGNCVLTSASLTQDQCVLNLVDCNEPPLNINYCYGNNDDTTWLFQSTDGSPVRLTFNAGGIESCCDDILVYDGSDNTGALLYQGNNGGNLAGLQFDSTGDSLFLEIDADGSVSCASGSGCCTAPWDFTVNCATCVNPVAAYDVVSDCVTGPQFLVDVNLTDLGSASSITLTDNQGSSPLTVTSTGTYSFGPYANTTDVIITVTNDDDSNCVLTSSTLTQEFCQDFVVDCSTGASNLNFCYANGGATAPVIFTFTSNDGNSLNLTFNAGEVETGWDELVVIDTDGSFIVDPADLFYGNNGDLTGLTYQSTGDTISFYINSDGVFDCGSEGFTPIDVSVTCATCTNPSATYTVRGDCLSAPQFFVDTDVTSLGSATSLTLTDNQGSAPQTITAAGLVTFGPYPNTTDVIITLTNDDDSNCIRSSSTLTQEYCLEYLVDCAVGPLNNNFCYFNDIDDDPSVATFVFTSSDGSALNLTFNSGQVESCCDELVVIDSDGTELYNGTIPGGNIAGLTFQSSGDTISWYLNSDISVSCESGSYPEGIDYTVACATCINPAATYAVVDDCDNGDQFLIDVNITSIGDATDLTISNNFDASTTAVTSTGVYQIGPFPFSTPVVVTISNDNDPNCVINSTPIQVLACPPANDNCEGAIVAGVNPGESCDIVTSGTILAATPSGLPAGSCGGNPDDDVWFQFTAQGAQQVIQLFNLTGGTTNLDHALYSGSCGNLVELYCSADLFSTTSNLTIGNTYYIRVFSAGSVAETTNFDLCIQTLGNPTYCLEALPICSGPVYDSVVGDDVAPAYLDYDCLGSVPDPTWNTILFDEGGNYTFTLAQTGTDGLGNDIDFIVWGPFDAQAGACVDLIPANIADCSFSATAIETITLNNVQAGDLYIILITNYSQQEGTYTFNIATGPPDGTNCEVVCGVTVEYQDTEVLEDLANPGFGEPINLCGFESITLSANSPYADFYEWYKDGFAFSNDETVTITESGIYQVLVNGNVCEGNSLSLQVPVILGEEPVANPLSDLVTCDDASGDGFEQFDLESQTPIVLGSQDASIFNVTYHLTLEDANTGTGALSSPYTNISNPQTIYVRVEDANATFCIATTSFNLEISGPTPTVTSVDYSICDDGSNDGFASFDLTTQNALVLGTQNPADFTVSYYLTESEASDGTSGALTSPYINVTNPQTIWVRIESNISTSCFTVGSMTLTAASNPMTTLSTDSDGFEVCPDATVPIILTAVPGNYTSSEVSVVWYRDGGELSGETGLSLEVLTAGLYEVEVTFTATGCSARVGQEVMELESCVIPQGISPGSSPGQNDTFDLSSFNVTRLEIFNRNGRLVYSLDNYTDQWYGQTDDGEELPVGTYFYTMVYEGGAKTRSSWVYINR